MSLWVGALLAGITLAWDASQARAGEYTVWSCRGPAGLPISAAAWQLHISDATAADMTATDQCAGGGPLLLEATPREIIQNRNPTGEAIFQPPAGTVIPHFKVWRYTAANDGPSTPPTTDDYAASLREWPVGAEGEGFISECGFLREEPSCAYGTEADPLGEANLVTEHTWTAEAPGKGCRHWKSSASGSAACAAAANRPPQARPPSSSCSARRSRSRTNILRWSSGWKGRWPNRPRSPASPTSPSPRPTRAAASPPSPSRSTAVRRSGSAATGAGSCEEPFSLPQPCPTTATRGISVDTAGLAPGGHTVAGAVADAAGNATPFGPVAFTVAAPAASRRADDRRRGEAARQRHSRGDESPPAAVEGPRLASKGQAGAAARLVDDARAACRSPARTCRSRSASWDRSAASGRRPCGPTPTAASPSRWRATVPTASSSPTRRSSAARSPAPPPPWSRRRSRCG